jgi:hypothetical protein
MQEPYQNREFKQAQSTTGKHHTREMGCDKPEKRKYMNLIGKKRWGKREKGEEGKRIRPSSPFPLFPFFPLLPAFILSISLNFSLQNL